MPEGDTIFNIAARIRPKLEGKRIERVEFDGIPSIDFERSLLERLTTSGKHLILHFQSGRCIRVHLGLYGSWHRYRHGSPWKKPRRRARLCLHTERELFVCFNARDVEIIPSHSLDEHKTLRALGPDLLDEGFAPVAALERVRARDQDRIIADTLLDQTVAAGVGNVYKCEILFLCRIHPETPTHAVTDAQLLSLYRTAQDAMGDNLRLGPRTTRRTSSPTMDGSKWVYGRTGLPCVECGTAIRRATLGMSRRGTWWCPGCQPCYDSGSSSQ